MNKLSIRTLVYIAFSSAIFIVFSTLSIKLAFTPVPITLQTLAVILVALILKPKYAFTSVMIVIFIGILGLPVFSGKSGLTHLLGPTGGFIFSFPIAAYLISKGIDSITAKATKLNLKHYIFILLLFVVCSSWFSHVLGVAWFATVLDDMTLSKAFALASLPYLLPDLVKCFIGFAIFITLSNTLYKLRSQQK